MNNKPDFIDNINDNTLANVLKSILEKSELEENDNNLEKNQLSEARIATAYFSAEGFSKISSVLKDMSCIKLILGSEPIIDSVKWQKKLGQTDDQYIEKKFNENLKKQEQSLKDERNNLPFSKNSSLALKKLISFLKSGNMEVRRYEDSFLHAKAYIFSRNEKLNSDNSGFVIAGSSNLTASGLSRNKELNLGKYNLETFYKSINWFEKIWEDAEPFDLAYIYEEIFESKSPFDIFLRVLYELYGDEVEDETKVDEGLPLTTFQKHGVARALRLINETGGVIIADEVGLGKTFIAAEILKEYKDRRQKALLICPAALRDSSWEKFKNEYELYLETYSFEEIAQDKQLWDQSRRPNAKSKNIKRDIDEYQLIIIDEAHNYRNPDSPTRADALRALLYGKRKDVLMLTATPVNNSLWDLYNLTGYFLKQDSFLADKGILSIRERFDTAMRTNPNNLSPDLLYPIIDATTVKRTREFIKKHYRYDQVNINGVLQTIVFPEPVAVTVRYQLDSLLPGLFDLIESYFDPENPECIKFARYKTSDYLKTPSLENDRDSNTVKGLILSGLLKRFESSKGAFEASIQRLVRQHELFLKALSDGFILTSEFFQETLSIEDDSEFYEFLEKSFNAEPDTNYDSEILKKDISEDLNKLKNILDKLKKITPDVDPKLKVLREELRSILNQAKIESTSREDEIDKRKVIIFSFFADTVRWIKNYLLEVVANDDDLAPYRERIEIVVGSGSEMESNKTDAAERFAPKTSGKRGDPDLTDILITTDVLSEGVNLQQARHIINYDMPWNPMKLVQRHGRIDRIGSEHTRVFMRTIFPADRLDALLGLEERIARKIAMAAASVGIVSPISSVSSTNRDFTETREEIQRLIDEDSTLYEKGGTKSGVQSGEEYRQTLRKELEFRKQEIISMPWKSGSGMIKGNYQGVFYCAKVGERIYLRFVHADKNWMLKYTSSNSDLISEIPDIDSELGTCLRIIECDEKQEFYIDEKMQDAAFEFWDHAKNDIYLKWSHETDPINLQPRVRPLNRRVADFLRENTIAEIEAKDLEKALQIIESPWRRRDERNLRSWFNLALSNKEKAKVLIQNVLLSGLEPFISPEPLPPIEKEDIKLINWIAITSTD